MSREDKIAFILSSNLFFEKELEQIEDRELDQMIARIIKFLEEAEKGSGFEIKRSMMIYLN